MTKMVMKRRRVPHHPPPQPDQYKILKVISRGSYGVVYKARDNKSGETVAVKEEIHEMCRSTSTEIDILKTLPRHRHIVGLINVVMGRARVFVVMEYMKYDLLMAYEPEKRITAADALNHPWFHE